MAHMSMCPLFSLNIVVKPILIKLVTKSWDQSEKEQACTRIRASLLVRTTACVCTHVQEVQGRDFWTGNLNLRWTSEIEDRSVKYSFLQITVGSLISSRGIKNLPPLTHKPTWKHHKPKFLSAAFSLEFLYTTNSSCRRDQLRQFCCAMSLF